MSDPCFHFSFAIGILNPAGHGHNTVVREHIPKEWIESGIVNISNDDSLAQIIEHHDARTPTESAKGFLMQLSPDTGTGTPDQQPHRLAAVAERQHEQARAAIFSALRIAHHRARSVIGLCFFSSCGVNNPHGLGLCRTAKLVNKTLHGLVAMGKAMIRNQVLPNSHSIPATTESLLDPFAERLAGTGDPILVARWRRNRRAKVGGHLIGRFCRRSPSPGTGRSYSDPGRLEVSACCFSTHTREFLDAP